MLWTEQKTWREKHEVAMRLTKVDFSRLRDAGAQRTLEQSGTARSEVLPCCHLACWSSDAPRLCESQQCGHAIQLFPRRQRNMLVSKDDLPRLLHRKMFARNVVSVMARENEQVRMGHAIARHYIAHSAWMELRTNPSTQLLSQLHDPCGQLIVDIHEVVDMAFGDQKAFARMYGFMIHEAQDGLIFIKRTCGCRPGDDLTKNARRISDR
jgi:hypothetical protein